jgi:hypothetical protein
VRVRLETGRTLTARLDTLLGKALVEERLLGPHALEDALQQHVLHGGAFDTVLLELGSVPEAVLGPLLAKAWGTAPVDVDELSRLDPSVAKSLPARMALAMRLCPLRAGRATRCTSCPARRWTAA